VLTPTSLERVYAVTAQVITHPLHAGLPLVLFAAAPSPGRAALG
jgi:hypothetical protein